MQKFKCLTPKTKKNMTTQKFTLFIIGRDLTEFQKAEIWTTAFQTAIKK